MLCCQETPGPDLWSFKKANGIAKKLFTHNELEFWGDSSVIYHDCTFLADIPGTDIKKGMKHPCVEMNMENEWMLICYERDGKDHRLYLDVSFSLTNPVVEC